MCSSDLNRRWKVTHKPKEKKPLIDWIKPQGRFKHLFTDKNTHILDSLQQRLDEDWDLEFRLFSQSKALLYPQIRCHRRIFDDGTRHFYSIQGQKKSPQEQLQINQQQQQIIGRYLDNIVWNSATRQRFQQRHQQLNH